ncbi:MAG: SDR family oxidoreductase, partial [Planctomycetota bacterium]|nr:SDR family oxidoreductase [Planctomycetota bacterium]
MTGAANGLGRAWAERLLSAGATVIGLDLPEPLWETARGGLPFECLACDLGDSATFDDAIAELRRVAGDEPFDAVAHIAGIQSTGPWSAFADHPQRRRRILDVNAYGPIAWTERLEREGRILLDAPLL